MPSSMAARSLQTSTSTSSTPWWATLATSLRQAEVREQLHISAARLARACAVLQGDPPRGLQLEQDGERLALVTAPDCVAVVERHLGRPAPGPLSTAALEALAIVAYEQPITRADIRQIRGVDSDGVVDTLLAHGLVAEDPCFRGRGRPGFLVTTAAFPAASRAWLAHRPTLAAGARRRLTRLPDSHRPRRARGGLCDMPMTSTGRPHTVGYSSPEATGSAIDPAASYRRTRRFTGL